MGFARRPLLWTAQHLPGATLAEWERLGDLTADKLMSAEGPDQPEYGEPGLPSFDIFLKRLHAEGSRARVDPMPEWLDTALLSDGMQFFVEAWPLVFLSFGWAVVGGFGCESASAVLLESRYWAASGASGRRDTWKRLRETACWLYDICMPGAAAFAPGGSAWTAALHIRYLHARTRTTLIHSHPGTFDSDAFGTPINQLQLVGTLLGSSVLLLQGIEAAMGMPLRQRDAEGFVHLWRVIGHLFGIDEDKNPNRNYERACVVMESVFVFAIPAAPRPELTQTLTAHIYGAVAQGFKEDAGIPVSERLLSAQARLYLGHEYSDAIGLPRVSWYHTFLAFSRMLVFRCFFCLYFCFQKPRGVGATIHSYGIRPLYRAFMRRSFTALVNDVRARQPLCRFGKCLDATAVPQVPPTWKTKVV